MQILIGRKTLNIKGPFDVLYAGHDGAKLLEAATANAKKGYARMEKICFPTTVPVRVEAHLQQVAEAEARAKQERAEADEAARQAELLKTDEAKAKAAKEEAEAKAAEAKATEAKAKAAKAKQPKQS